MRESCRPRRPAASPILSGSPGRVSVPRAPASPVLAASYRLPPSPSGTCVRPVPPCEGETAPDVRSYRRVVFFGCCQGVSEAFGSALLPPLCPGKVAAHALPGDSVIDVLRVTHRAAEHLACRMPFVAFGCGAADGVPAEHAALPRSDGVVGASCPSQWLRVERQLPHFDHDVPFPLTSHRATTPSVQHPPIYGLGEPAGRTGCVYVAHRGTGWISLLRPCGRVVRWRQSRRRRGRSRRAASSRPSCGGRLEEWALSVQRFVDAFGPFKRTSSQKNSTAHGRCPPDPHPSRQSRVSPCSCGSWGDYDVITPRTTEAGSNLV